MKDTERFIRLKMDHENGKEVAIVQAITNKQPKRKLRNVRWKVDSDPKTPNALILHLDFLNKNPTWDKETDRYSTGGNIFGGRKEVFEFKIYLDGYKVNKHPEYIIRVEEIDIIRPTAHVGIVHLPGGSAS